MGDKVKGCGRKEKAGKREGEGQRERGRGKGSEEERTGTDRQRYTEREDRGRDQGRQLDRERKDSVGLRTASQEVRRRCVFRRDVILARHHSSSSVTPLCSPTFSVNEPKQSIKEEAILYHPKYCLKPRGAHSPPLSLSFP